MDYTLKDSCVAWQGWVPSHWNVLPLGRLAAQKKKTMNPALPAGSISFGRVVYKDEDAIPESTRDTYQEVLPGEILVNPLNLNFDLKSLRIALSDKAVCVSPGYFVMRPTDAVDANYLRYVLHEFDVKHMKTLGAGIRQSVTYNHVAKEKVAIPPLATQTAIADYLDRKTTAIDALIAKKELLIAELRKYQEAVIAETVAPRKGWSITRLKRVAEFNPRVPADLAGATEVSFLPMQALSEFGPTDLSQTKLVSAAKAGYTYFADGDVAYAKVTPCFENGKGAIFAGLTQGVGFGTTEITVLRPKPCCTASFLAYVLQSRTFKEHGVACMEGAGGLKRVPDDAARDFECALPGTEAQIELSEKLDFRVSAITALVANSRAAIEGLKAYRAALISEAVTGKLSV